jgi:hypothetical protein
MNWIVYSSRNTVQAVDIIKVQLAEAVQRRDENRVMGALQRLEYFLSQKEVESLLSWACERL